MNNINIKNELIECVSEIIECSNLNEGDIFVLGCSSSEVKGNKIGKSTDLEIGKLIVNIIYDILNKKGLYLAVQCCEHLNRALVVEKEIALKNNLEIVSVIPKSNAGGAAAAAAYEIFENPVVVEKIIANAGIDIGDTSIGMHIKFVQVPIRTEVKKIGHAHVSALKTRPKLIGGIRAEYS